MLGRRSRPTEPVRAARFVLPVAFLVVAAAALVAPASVTAKVDAAHARAYADDLSALRQQHAKLVKDLQTFMDDYLVTMSTIEDLQDETDEESVAELARAKGLAGIKCEFYRAAVYPGLEKLDKMARAFERRVSWFSARDDRKTFRTACHDFVRAVRKLGVTASAQNEGWQAMHDGYTSIAGQRWDDSLTGLTLANQGFRRSLKAFAGLRR